MNEVEEAKTALAAAGQELADRRHAGGGDRHRVERADQLNGSRDHDDDHARSTATIERVQQAEDDLAQAGEGITAATPLAEATAEYNSAAFALQIAWLRLFHEPAASPTSSRPKRSSR